MSEGLDTKALRALREKATKGKLRAGDGTIHTTDKFFARFHVNPNSDADYVAALVNAAPALLDAADECDALRTRVAELERHLAAADNLALVHSRELSDWDEVARAALGDEACNSDGPHSAVQSALARVAELEREVERLRSFLVPLFTSGYLKGHHDTVEANYTNVYPVDTATYFADDVAEWIAQETAALSPSAPAKGDGGEANRCDICGWPLAESRDKGCVVDDCSYRPEQGSEEWYRIKARRDAKQAAKATKEGK